MNIENELIDNESNDAEFGLSNNIVGYLKETRKWTNFLAIFGFIMIFFMLIGSIAIWNSNGNFKTSEEKTMFSILYFVFAIIYFFPLYYLIMFSSKMKKALKSKNKLFLEEAFKNLKSHYKFIGIYLIITISLIIISSFAQSFFGPNFRS